MSSSFKLHNWHLPLKANPMDYEYDSNVPTDSVTSTALPLDPTPPAHPIYARLMVIACLIGLRRTPGNNSPGYPAISKAIRTSLLSLTMVEGLDINTTIEVLERLAEIISHTNSPVQNVTPGERELVDKVFDHSTDSLLKPESSISSADSLRVLNRLARLAEKVPGQNIVFLVATWASHTNVLVDKDIKVSACKCVQQVMFKLTVDSH